MVSRAIEALIDQSEPECRTNHTINSAIRPRMTCRSEPPWHVLADHNDRSSIQDYLNGGIEPGRPTRMKKRANPCEKCSR